MNKNSSLIYKLFNTSCIDRNEIPIKICLKNMKMCLKTI